MDEGFQKGQSDNLPKVDSFMLLEYLTNHLKFTSAEIRGWKTQRSAREGYGDDAVGYVQVRRDNDICTVKANITPEHKVRCKGYSCILKCNEKDETIQSIECNGCVAQKGGCKHSVAFLMWVYRRSEEPSATEIKCYWAKPKLAKVGTSLKFIKAKEIGSSAEVYEQISTDNFFDTLIEKLKTCSIRNQLSNYIWQNDLKQLSLHLLINLYRKEGNDMKSAQSFIDYCSTKLNSEICSKIEEHTLSQADSPLWYDELRYCRITASKVHDAAHCKTVDGSLVEQIFGATIRETAAMQRGKSLEPKVRSQVSKLKKLVIESGGLFFKSDWPILGASPDGLTKDYVIEIKCPMTAKGKETFVKNNLITKKSRAQIQLQMFFCNKPKGLFCIADENFEANSKIEIFEEEYDKDFCTNLLEKSTRFWKESVFFKLAET